MTLSVAHFTETLRGLQGLMPFAKPLSESAFLLAWASFPDQAKQELTNDALTWAAAKLVQDPEAHKELPLHLRLHRMLYSYTNLSTSGLTIGPVPMGWRLKVDPHRLPPVDAPPPLSEAEQVAAGCLPAYDGPRHDQSGLLSQLQATTGAIIDAHPECSADASRMIDRLTIAQDNERCKVFPWLES